MRDKYGVEQDLYCYPNSTVLVNLLNIQNENLLEEAETEFSLIRASEYLPSFEQFDLNLLKAIHHHLFQDLYKWAGDIRRVDISKNGTRFCNVDRIEQEAIKLFHVLANENNLCNLERITFIERTAHYYCELNVIHPFRDGNGRTLRLFFEELAIHAGFEFSWSGIEQDDWLYANIEGYNSNLLPLIKLFEGITTPL